MTDGISVPRGCVKTDARKDVFTLYTSAMNLSDLAYYYTTYSSRTIRRLSFEGEELLGDDLGVYPHNKDELIISAKKIELN